MTPKLTLFLAGCALASPAAHATPVDCRERGLVILLGAGSAPVAEGFAYWAHLSNPGFGRVYWRWRFGDAPPGPVQHLDGSRQLRMELGRGAVRLTPDEVARALVLSCAPA